MFYSPLEAPFTYTLNYTACMTESRKEIEKQRKKSTKLTAISFLLFVYIIETYAI